MMSGLLKGKIKSALVIAALTVTGNFYAQLGLNWSEMGPNDISGRCRSIVIDKMDASGNTIYAAGVSGGIFKTTNAGQTWAAVNDQAPCLIVSCMSQAPDGTIYFGTGETFSRGNDGSGTSGFIGTGLYKLNGTTITLVKDSTMFGNVNEVAVDQTNGQRIYVATERGFFYSNDGGSSFTQEPTTGSTPAMDVKIAKDNSVFFSSGSKTSTTSQIYYSSTGISAYANITPTLTNSNALPSSLNSNGRIELATAPSDANVVYASIAKTWTKGTTNTSGLSVLYVSLDKGNTWNVITTGNAQRDPLGLPGVLGYGDYSNAIAVYPSNANIIFIGGYDTYIWSQNPSLAPGQGDWSELGVDFYSETYPFTQLFLHTKPHDIKFSGHYAFIATDGGIYRADNSNGGFILSVNNGFNISQFNSVAYQNFPRNTSTTNTVSPKAGVMGGTIGSGIDYIPGNLNTVQTSLNYIISGNNDAYQSDFSKILPKAAFYSTSLGAVLRSNDLSISAPSSFEDVQYKLNLAGAAEATPMRLWENYGSNPVPDSTLFYNPPIKTTFFNSNKTQTSFTVTNTRPQKSAKYDTIYVSATSTKTVGTFGTVKTFTVSNANNTASSFSITNTRTQSFARYDSIVIRTTSTKQLAPPAAQTITIAPQYNASGVMTGYNVAGTTSTNNAVYYLSSLNDSIRFTFTNPPKDSSNFNVRIKMRYIQNIVIVPTYTTGGIIQSYNVSGSAALTPTTNNMVILKNSLLDSIRYTFLTPPSDSSTIVTTVKLRYDAGDYITNSNTDISGLVLRDSILLSSVFSSNSKPAIRKIPVRRSARLAVGAKASIYAVKRPLNFAQNPDWFKIAGPNSKRDSPGGVSTSTDVITPVQGVVTLVEWAPDGNCLYFCSKLNDSTFYLYRTSHLEFLGDSAAADYSGFFSSDIDSGSVSVVRKGNRIRTTAIANFRYQITSISVRADNAGLMLTCGSYKNKVATVYTSNGDVRTLNYNITDNSAFTPKNGSGLPLTPAYSSLFEMSDNKRALIGTEVGLYSTTDITAASPAWVKETGTSPYILPNVPV
ncbi:MAG: WD40/YVTN/BNR-like repeat-containing protein, partial [Bacteroidia bacterium]